MNNKIETNNPGEVGESGWESVEAMADQFQADKAAETDVSSETLTASNNVYREIAKNALKNWNGLSEEEAAEKVSGTSLEELESQIYAKNSINSAIDCIEDALHHRGIDLEDSGMGFDAGDLEEAIYNGKNTDEAFRDLKANLEKVEDKEEFILDVLAGIHKNWVQSNFKKINDPSRLDKRYQALPLELIGFDEAKSDLLFLEPILDACGMGVDEQKLKKAYEDYGTYDCKRELAVFTVKNTGSTPNILNAKEIFDNWAENPTYSEEDKGILDIISYIRNVYEKEGYLYKVEGHFPGEEGHYFFNDIDFNNTEHKSGLNTQRGHEIKGTVNKEEIDVYCCEIAEQLLEKKEVKNIIEEYIKAHETYNSQR